MRYATGRVSRTIVPAAGSDIAHPVRRVSCVGRNHAADALASGGADMADPVAPGELHHEIELIVALSRGGGDVLHGQLDGSAGHSDRVV